MVVVAAVAGIVVCVVIFERSATKISKTSHNHKQNTPNQIRHDSNTWAICLGALLAILWFSFDALKR